jgi:tellurite resistance protein TehA-like permease
VVAKHEVVGDFADGRAGGIRVALDRQEQLMLRRRKARRLGSLLAPTQESTQTGAQLQQLFEVPLGRFHIVSRYRALTMTVRAEWGSAVMATGIVSVALYYEGSPTLSRVLLAIGAVAWTILAGLAVLAVLFDHLHAREEAKRPAALTAVAATAVLGVRLTLLGWTWAGWALLVIAAALPALLLPALARAGPLPRTGGSFLVVVAVQSLAALAATLASSTAHSWPAFLALAPCALGLAAYPIVLARFDLSELRRGAGDHWVSGGALAISTLSCAEIGHALSVAHGPAGFHDPLRVASLVLWGATVAWLPALMVAELRWPRPGYDVGRWATVFPLGMYAVMSTGTGSLAGLQGVVRFGHVAAWVAFAVWIATAVGWGRRQLPLIGRCVRLGRGAIRRGPDGAVPDPTLRSRT